MTKRTFLVTGATKGIGLAISKLLADNGLVNNAGRGSLQRVGEAVNSVSPGPTETELLRKNTPVGSEAERIFFATHSNATICPTS